MKNNFIPESISNFDFNGNKNKFIAVLTKDNKTVIGKNLGLMPDDVVVIEFDTTHIKANDKQVAFGLCEIPITDIQYVKI